MQASHMLRDLKNYILVIDIFSEICYIEKNFFKVSLYESEIFCS